MMYPNPPLGCENSQAFPIAELALFNAGLSLAAAMINVVNGIFFTVGTVMGLAGSMISELDGLIRPIVGAMTYRFGGCGSSSMYPHGYERHRNAVLEI